MTMEALCNFFSGLNDSILLKKQLDTLGSFAQKLGTNSLASHDLFKLLISLLNLFSECYLSWVL